MTQSHAQKLREVAFRVSCTTNPGETVCVVGNCPQLGNWKHGGSFPLQRKAEYESAENPEVWHGQLALPIGKDIKFRYFVCMILDIPIVGVDPAAERSHIVRRWESNVQPRLIKQLKYNESCLDDGDIDIFGVFNGDREIIEHGWVTAETCIQFKVSNNPIQFWRKRFRNSPIRVRMVSVNLARQNSISEFPDGMDYQDSSSACDEPIPGWPIIEVGVLNENEYQLTLQQQFGRAYKDGEIMIFQAQVLQPHTVAYMMDFYVDNNEDIPQHIGFCHILPSNLKESMASITVPITSVKQEPLGQINIEYIVVKPLRNLHCDMKVSFSRYWKHQEWKGLDIGHRGSGNSGRRFQSCANIRENTIASLQKAAEHEADFVEFDVQLSKDLIPVLFHDFYVNIGLHQKAEKGGELTTLQIPVKDLTLNQLHELKGYLIDWADVEQCLRACPNNNFSAQVCNTAQQEQTIDNISKRPPRNVFHVGDEPQDDDCGHDDDHDPFPTLELALKTMPSHVGFNVEIKWGMQLKYGSWELENPVELNMYLDIVLETVLKYGGLRRVVFSCFHPDICTVIRLKQNKYPVLFLTQGITSKYPEYNDPRTQNIPIAINYARFAGILGLSVHTEDILRDPTQVQEIVNHELVAFCWGDDNNDAATIKYLKELGLNGIIFDRIEDHIEADKTSIFFTEHQEELLQLAAMSPEAELEDSNPFSIPTENNMDVGVGGQVGTNGTNGTNGIANIIEFNQDQIVHAGKSSDIDSTSLFPTIASSLNLAVKECGV